MMRIGALSTMANFISGAASLRNWPDRPASAMHSEMVLRAGSTRHLGGFLAFLP